MSSDILTKAADTLLHCRQSDATLVSVRSSDGQVVPKVNEINANTQFLVQEIEKLRSDVRKTTLLPKSDVFF